MIDPNVINEIAKDISTIANLALVMHLGIAIVCLGCLVLLIMGIIKA